MTSPNALATCVRGAQQSDPRDLVADFVRYVVDVRRGSHNTAKNYRLDLLRVADFADRHCGSGWDWLDVDPKLVRRYGRKQLMRGLKMRTLSRHVSAIKSFYKFLHNCYDLDNHAICSMRTPKYGRLLPHWLSRAQIDRLFAYLEERAATGPARAIRNLAIIETLYSTGMRLSEAVGLELYDLDFARRLVRIRGKARNRRVVPLGSQAVTALERYLSTDLMRRDEVVFLAQRNGRLNRIGCKGVQEMLEPVYRELFGHEHGFNIHSLRHSCAVHMMDAGASLIAMAELLGHVSVLTTEVYGRCSIEYLKEQHHMAHPRA